MRFHSIRSSSCFEMSYGSSNICKITQNNDRNAHPEAQTCQIPSVMSNQDIKSRYTDVNNFNQLKALYRPLQAAAGSTERDVDHSLPLLAETNQHRFILMSANQR